MKAIRDDYKDFVKDLMSQYFFQNGEEMVNDLKICRPYMEELADLVNDFGQKF